MIPSYVRMVTSGPTPRSTASYMRGGSDMYISECDMHGYVHTYLARTDKTNHSGRLLPSASKSAQKNKIKKMSTLRPRLPPLLLRTLTPQRRHNSAHNAHWVSEAKTRLGRLFFHGCTTAETEEAGQILQDITREWRRYIAGAEGYLVSAERRGLYRLPVAWGDMVGFLRGAEGGVEILC